MSERHVPCKGCGMSWEQCVDFEDSQGWQACCEICTHGGCQHEFRLVCKTCGERTTPQQVCGAGCSGGPCVDPKNHPPTVRAAAWAALLILEEAIGAAECGYVPNKKVQTVSRQRIADLRAALEAQ